MPELPEVENTARSLFPITGSKITGVSKSLLKLRYQSDSSKYDTLTGQKIEAITRRVRYIHIKLEKNSLWCHLGMTGWLRIAELSDPIQKHDHITLNLSNGQKLIYNDPRRFGGIEVSTLGQIPKYINELGYEPLEITKEERTSLINKIKEKTTPIKPLLMDNSILTGVGNIYAAESLFKSKISPKKQSNKLSRQKIDQLITSVQNTLQIAIDNGGSSIKNYRMVNGSSGNMQNLHAVYNKHNKPCPECGSLIKKITQSGRSTFYCSHCQK